jgi:hypothetical protein
MTLSWEKGGLPAKPLPDSSVGNPGEKDSVVKFYQVRDRNQV